jgi:DNA-binding NtrC family response regulator
LVDDDVLLCDLLQRWLEGEGFEVAVFHDGESCLTALTGILPDVVCTDLSLPGIDGLETLERIKAHHPRMPVLVMTAHSGVESAVHAMKSGAYDYLVKPVERTKFVTEITNAVERSQMSIRLTQLEREAEGRAYPGIVGQSRPMRELFRRLDRVAASDITVMIHGESGTGKELVARAIHGQSSRSYQPFVAVSCAAIPESLQESELFGHEKGAFTGATSRRQGCFERANRGTLFLDEIAELSASLQAKLLRVLQERAFQRVGGSTEIHSDFRLIVATHRDLAAEVRNGKFREDLYFRIVVMDVAVPPLRDRADDIPELVAHFLAQARGKPGEQTPEVSPDTMAALMAYDWPGNVRELQNAIERAMVECDGKTIHPHHLPANLRGRGQQVGVAPSQHTEPTSAAVRPDLQAEPAAAFDEPAKTMDEIEREAIAAALARSNGNISKVVRELGIGRTTLYRKIKKYGLR